MSNTVLNKNSQKALQDKHTTLLLVVVKYSKKYLWNLAGWEISVTQGVIYTSDKTGLIFQTDAVSNLNFWHSHNHTITADIKIRVCLSIKYFTDYNYEFNDN